MKPHQNPNRRQALAAVAALAPAATFAQAVAPPPMAAKITPFEIKPLPFDPAKIPGLSERLLKSHWENNYAGAIRALNNVRERLAILRADKDTPAFLYGELKRERVDPPRIHGPS
jgi:superoxide dismutase, Fe-Mn family